MVKVGMIRRGHEGGQRKERLSYSLKLPLAIVLGRQRFLVLRLKLQPNEFMNYRDIYADNFDE